MGGFALDNISVTPGDQLLFIVGGDGVDSQTVFTADDDGITWRLTKIGHSPFGRRDRHDLELRMRSPPEDLLVLEGTPAHLFLVLEFLLRSFRGNCDDCIIVAKQINYDAHGAASFRRY